MSGLPIYLKWNPRRGRAEAIAGRLGVELVVLPWRASGPRWRRAIRLARLIARTVAWLLRRRPEVVFFEHTTPGHSLAVLIYRLLGGGRIVADCHNAPFQNPLWARPAARTLNRWVLSCSAVALVHNEPLLRHVRDRLRLPGRFRLLHSTITQPAPGACPPVRRPAVLVIASFSGPEPIEALLGAAGRTPQVHYYVSGDPARAERPLPGRLPDNVTLTGYLPDETFDALLCGADAAVTLDVRGRLLQLAAHQAVGAAAPLVCSDGEAARDHLTMGVVLVENTAESIAAGVTEALARGGELRREMAALADLRRREQQAQIDSVWAALGR